MTEAQQAKLALYRNVLEVCARNGLAIGHQPPFRKASQELAAAVKALEGLLAHPPPEDASYRQQDDYTEQVAAGFRAADWAIEERMLPHLAVFEFNAPAFFGQMKTALMTVARMRKAPRKRSS